MNGYGVHATDLPAAGQVGSMCGALTSDRIDRLVETR